MIKIPGHWHPQKRENMNIRVSQMRVPIDLTFKDKFYILVAEHVTLVSAIQTLRLQEYATYYSITHYGIKTLNYSVRNWVSQATL